jgi:uncharacterized repeat protein (TIGR01451 family)
MLMLIVGLALCVGLGRSRAAEVPPAGGFYIQTGGPNTAVTIGDWYTSSTAGAGAGYHYLTILVPCGWPAGTPLHIDLFSPEMNRVAGSAGIGDEPRNDYDSTQFELYGPNATIGPGYANPGPGTGIAGSQVTYQPGAPGVPEAWVRYRTLSPVTCGSYLLRAEVLATDPLNPMGEGDDDNGWRLRVGTDDDADPTTSPPADYDNPDGVPGTNDEIVIGQVQITYQHTIGGVACLTLYEYVPPGLPSVTFHNFDMDGSTRVRYYAPSDAFDATGLTGGTPGTLSTNGAWNGGTLARAGDTLADPEAGWWRIVSCLGSNNQFIQEAQAGIGIFFAQPPTPALQLAKTDGTAVATAGGTLTYELTIANSASGSTAGAAHAVTLTDQLPADATFVSCSMVAPATGTCGEAGGVVTATLDDWINAGGAATVEVTVRIDADATGSATNQATVAYEDGLGNAYPEASATDVDAIVAGPPPSPSPVPSESPRASSIPDVSVATPTTATHPWAGPFALGLALLVGAATTVILRRHRRI